MNPKFATAERVPLTEDDKEVLNVIFQTRSRLFIFVFVALLLVALLGVFPFLYQHKNWYLVSGSILGLLLLVFFPGFVIYRTKIWAFRQDVRSGFKLKVLEEIIDKLYFENTDQYFLSLSDVDYLHHEVLQADFEAAQIGGTYPIFFSSHAHYAFNLRTTITLM